MAIQRRACLRKTKIGGREDKEKIPRSCTGVYGLLLTYECEGRSSTFVMAYRFVDVLICSKHELSGTRYLNLSNFFRNMFIADIVQNISLGSILKVVFLCEGKLQHYRVTIILRTIHCWMCGVFLYQMIFVGSINTLCLNFIIFYNFIGVPTWTRDYFLPPEAENFLC